MLPAMFWALPSVCAWSPSCPTGPQDPHEIIQLGDRVAGSLNDRQRSLDEILREDVPAALTNKERRARMMRRTSLVKSRVCGSPANVNEATYN